MKFEAGDRVKYVGGHDYDTPSLIGKTGTVIKYFDDDPRKKYVTVQFDEKDKLPTTLCAPNFIKIVDEKEEPEFKSQFVETKTITNVKTCINTTIKNNAVVSVKPNTYGETIDLVIGAKYENRSACCFGKRSLADLIQELQAIHDAM